MRLLVVEDDPQIVGYLEDGLREAGFQVEAVSSGEDGYLAARYNPYDLVLLDLTLPGMDGLDVARKLRAEGSTTPILMLTGRDSEPDTVRGLDVGADDYLTKPYGFEELLARVRALLRRGSMARSSVMTFEDLEVDTTRRKVTRAGQEITLSAREYALLEYLLYHAGQVVTRELLMENVWSDSIIESNVIDVYIGYLRRKIDAPFDKPLIKSVRGMGYGLLDS